MVLLKKREGREDIEVRRLFKDILQMISNHLAVESYNMAL